jgi:hypothetical protein
MNYLVRNHAAVIAVLLASVALSSLYDAQGQLFRRWRNVQPATTTVCGPDGCVAYPTTTVYQERRLLPDRQTTYFYSPTQFVSQPVPTAPQVVQPASLPVYEPTQVSYQTPESTSLSSSEFMEVKSEFHKAVLEAGKKSLQSGEINRVQMLKIRAALLFPGPRKVMEEALVAQIATSGETSDGVKYNELGKVTEVNWMLLLDFLIKAMPYIIQIIEFFSQMGFLLYSPF